MTDLGRSFSLAKYPVLKKNNATLKKTLDCFWNHLDSTKASNFLVTLKSKMFFEFNGKLYIQIVGKAIGTESEVTYSCIYLGDFDEIIKKYATKPERTLK